MQTGNVEDVCRRLRGHVLAQSVGIQTDRQTDRQNECMNGLITSTMHRNVLCEFTHRIAL